MELVSEKCQKGLKSCLARIEKEFEAQAAGMPKGEGEGAEQGEASPADPADPEKK